MTPHVWKPVGAYALSAPHLSRPRHRDVDCRRYGMRASAGQAEPVDRIPDWRDCDYMLVAKVMES